MTAFQAVNPFWWVGTIFGGAGRLLRAGLRAIKPKSRTGRLIYYLGWAWFWFPGTNTATILYIAAKCGYEQEVMWLLGKLSAMFWWIVDTTEFWYHAIPKIMKVLESIS